MVKEGHFELTSGLHSAVYFEKFRLLERPDITVLICQEIANRFRSEEFSIVVGPTTGGVIIAYEVARQLNKRCMFAEKEVRPQSADSGRELRRGFQFSIGEKILIVDDVLTTGGSIFQTISAVKKCGGTIIGVAVIVDRSEKKIDFNVPLFSVHKEEVKTWQASDCPLCKKGIELSKPGGTKKNKG